jgi:hypothetical protein
MTTTKTFLERTTITSSRKKRKLKERRAITLKLEQQFRKRKRISCEEWIQKSLTLFQRHHSSQKDLEIQLHQALSGRGGICLCADVYATCGVLRATGRGAVGGNALRIKAVRRAGSVIRSTRNLQKRSSISPSRVSLKPINSMRKKTFKIAGSGRIGRSSGTSIALAATTSTTSSWP